jgi:hypothetical protein
MLVSQSLQRAKDGTSSYNDDCLRKKGKVKNETMSIVKIKHKEEKKKGRKEERKRVTIETVSSLKSGEYETSDKGRINM